MNNYDLIQIINTLSRYENTKFPQKISYAITKNLMALQKEYAVYNSQLNKLFQKYDDDAIHQDGEVVKDINGAPIIKDEATRMQFHTELADLLNIEVEDTSLYTIDPETFNYDDSSGKYDAMTPTDIAVLQTILCATESK